MTGVDGFGEQARDVNVVDPQCRSDQPGSAGCQQLASQRWPEDVGQTGTKRRIGWASVFVARDGPLARPLDRAIILDVADEGVLNLILVVESPLDELPQLGHVDESVVVRFEDEPGRGAVPHSPFEPHEIL